MDADLRAPLAGLAPPGCWLGASRHGSAGSRRTRDFAAGRLAAARSMAAWGRAGTVGRGADGAPCWPPGIVGAITHRDGLALALTGASRNHAGLGIDLETLIDRPQEIARVILTPGEACLPPDRLTITLVFSAKESLFKALYPRVGRFGFDAAGVTALGPDDGALRLTRRLGPWPEGAAFRFRWRQRGRRVVTALSAQPLSVAPPST